MNEIAIPRPTILVAEDDANLRELLLESLLDLGFDTCAAGSGRLALEQIRQRKPDLVVSDIMMADGTGHELLRAIRSDRTLADLPVIFLSALSRGTDVRTGMNLGADDYLTKPLSLADLQRSVEARLARIHRFRSDRALPAVGAGGPAAGSPRMVLPSMELETWAMGVPGNGPDRGRGAGRVDVGRAGELAKAVSEAENRGADLLLTVRSGWVQCFPDGFDSAVEAVLTFAFRSSRAGDPVWVVGGWAGDHYQLTVWCRAGLPGIRPATAGPEAREPGAMAWPAHLPEDPALRWAGAGLRQAGGELRLQDCGPEGVRVHALFQPAPPLP